MSAAAAAAPIAIVVPVATLAYLVFRRSRGKKSKDEEKQPPATTTTTTANEDYGDLDSIVSFSSRVIAAARAVEHERADAFIRDPLAEALAGERAMKVARQRAEAAAAAAASEQPTTADSSSTKPSRAVPRLVMRTAFLDDAVLVAASGGAESASARRLLSTQKAADALTPLAEHVRAFASCPEAPPVHRLQVVLLGAGMDARPWRLPLPPGRVRWIEVDRGDVIAAKKKALTAIGAEVPSDSSSRPTSAASPQPAPPLVAPPQQQRPASSSSAIQAGNNGGAATTAVAASAPSSASARRPSAPVSIRSLQRSQSAAAAAAALGLPPDVVATAATTSPHKFPLKASAWAGVAADLTKPGWTAVLEREAGFDPRVPTLWVAEGLLYYLDPATVPGMLSEAASVSAPGSALVATIITDATLEAMRGSKAEQEKVNSTSAPMSEQVLSSAPALTSQFVWGAPAADVDGYFSASGWRCLQRPTWSKAAEGYGWRAERRAGSRVPEESQVQFLVAAVEKAAGR
jgi:O-methyltransferase involved in polyketide biosynthesis